MVAAGCGGDDDPQALPEGRFLAAEQEIEPRVGLFADPITAKVDLIVDNDRYDPDRVRVTTEFDPYERTGDVEITRKDLGRYTHLRYEYTLRCLVYACLPEVGGGPPQVQPGGLPPPPGTQAGGFGERKTFEFKNARVVYDDPDKGAQEIRSVAWPPVQSVSRLNLGDSNVTGIGFPFSASVLPLPEESYRVPPAVLGLGLICGCSGAARAPGAARRPRAQEGSAARAGARARAHRRSSGRSPVSRRRARRRSPRGASRSKGSFWSSRPRSRASLPAPAGSRGRRPSRPRGPWVSSSSR